MSLNKNSSCVTASEPPRAAAAVPRSTAAPKIALFGIFGVQNIGNECTLQAMLYNIRERLPRADVYTICYAPDDASRRHQLPAIAVDSRDRAAAPRKRSLPAKVLRKLVYGIPGQAADWFRSYKALQGTDVLVMTGTGMLTDYSTNCFGFPYDVVKWAVAARMAGTKVRFVGIGVGPIYERLSRAFIKHALGIADYRSFRDQYSRKKLQDMGMNTATDCVFPDLAFSLPQALFSANGNQRRERRVIGVGVMNFVDSHSTTPAEAKKDYERYLTKMSQVVRTLVENGYGVRILQGDMKHDTHVRHDLRRRLESAGMPYALHGIVDEDVRGVEELVEQLATVDVVVSPRFHNLILGILLGKPVVSLSYDPKHDVLLEAFGLGKYRHDIGDFDVNLLIEQLLEIDARSDEITPHLRQKTAECRELLAQQYQIILGDLYQPAG